MLSLSLVLIVLSLALLQGAIIGLLPGLPAIVGIILLIPFFQNWPVEAILLFFSCYICVTQYFGSVSALLFRIPGESSSIPALEVALKLKKFTSVVKAYRTTALTSLIGAVLGISLFVVMFYIFRMQWTYIFSTKFIVLFLSILLVLLVIQDKKYLFNTSMLLLGLGLCYINRWPALQPVCDTAEWMCFLRSPTEATLALLSLYCVPILFYRPDLMTLTHTKDITTSYMPTWRSIKSFWKLGLRHGFLGFLVGFTPGAGLTLASNLSNSIEKQRNSKKLLSMAGAAEASNNAAAISCTIPFLFLGLPITPSEIFIDNFLSTKLYRLNLTSLDQFISVAGYPIKFTLLLISCMLLINLISFLLCGHFIKFWRRLMSIDVRIYLAIIKLLLIASVIAVVITNNITWSAAIGTIVIFGALGTWIMSTGRNAIGLAFTLIAGQFVVEKMSTFYYMYF